MAARGLRLRRVLHGLDAVAGIAAGTVEDASGGTSPLVGRLFEVGDTLGYVGAWCFLAGSACVGERRLHDDRDRGGHVPAEPGGSHLILADLSHRGAGSVNLAIALPNAEWTVATRVEARSLRHAHVVPLAGAPGPARNGDRQRVSWTPGRIEDYALLSDLHTAALVGKDGGVDWLCLPNFDSPACFAALLADDHAGTWLLAPASGGAATRRRYRPDTLILESEWDTPDGTVRLVDCMPPRTDSTDLVRVVEGVSGRVPMRMLLRPRFDYGDLVPWTRFRGAEMTAVAGPNTVRLR
jgi:hypothetical protein